MRVILYKIVGKLLTPLTVLIEVIIQMRRTNEQRIETIVCEIILAVVIACAAGVLAALIF